MLAAIASSIGLWFGQGQFVERTVPDRVQTTVTNFAYRKPLIVQSAEHPTEQPFPQKAEKLTDTERQEFLTPMPEAVSIANAECLVLSPVSEKALGRIRPKLEELGFLNRVLIQPAEYFELLVYAGPFKTERSAQMMARKLEKKKIPPHVEELPDGRWRIVIGKFNDRKMAKDWATSLARDEQIGNIVVADRSPPGNVVQIVFSQLTEDENQRIRAAFSNNAAKASFFVCRY